MYMKKDKSADVVIDPIKQQEKIDKAKNLFLAGMKDINLASRLDVSHFLSKVFDTVHECFDFRELKQFYRPRLSDIKDATFFYLVDMGNGRKIVVHCYIERTERTGAVEAYAWEYKVCFVIGNNEQIFFKHETILDQF
jgi:hypothetical protein